MEEQTQSLSQMAQESYQEATGSESAPEAVTTPVTPTQETPAPTQETAPVVESDPNAPFDPAKLTDPNLQQAYKQMQSDYTKKMQSISEQEAKFAKYDKLLPVLDQLANGGQPASQEDPLVSSLTAELKEAGFDDSAIEVGKIITQKILANMKEQQAQAQMAQDQERTLSTVKDSFVKAVAADPRLNDQTLTYDVGNGETATFGTIVENLVAADPNWVKDPTASIQKAIRTVDGMLNTAKQQGKAELSEQAKVKQQKFAPVQGSVQGTVDAQEPMSIREAFEAARAEIGS
jgi:hypothetical protein